MPSKAFELKLQQLTDAGRFSGLASTYNSIDFGDDLVEPGAFTRTLAVSGKRRPLLWQHRDPVGVVDLTDSEDGLLAEGQLSMGIQQAKDAYTLLKDGVVGGLSIGFNTVKENLVGAVRHLQEVRLWEVSLVTFPMNEQARVSSVKAAEQAAYEAEVRRALRNFKNEVLKAL